MVRLLYLGATFALSLGLGLYLTPLMRRGAMRFGVLDAPDGDLKTHREPVPYLGGVAVYLAFLVSLGMIFEFQPELLGLLLGGTMVAMLGLFDDLRVLTPQLKLAGQLIAIFVLFRSGIKIQLVALPLLLSVPLTVAWIVGMTNAMNIVDVSDGLAAGVGAMAALGLFMVAIINGEMMIASATLALVGSLVGFLRYNQPPARIYLGDTGSMFVGFMLAALAMIGSYTQQSLVGVVAPILILGVPLLETALVVTARLRRGANPMRGSADHFAIRLKRARGWSAKRVAGYAYALGFVGAVAGVSVTLLDPAAAGVVAGAAIVVFLGNFVWLLSLSTPVAQDGALTGAPARPVAIAPEPKPVSAPK